MRAILTAVFWMFGIVGVAISLSILLLGAEATAGASERAMAALGLYRGPPSGPWPASMDSELRFYAALFGGYSLAQIWVARNLAARMPVVPWLAAMFFVGGVGRAISYVAVGPPHPFFLVLMGFELLAPPVWLCLWLGARAR